MNSRILIPKYPPNTCNRKRQGAISPRGDIHRKSTGKYGVSVYKNKSSGFLVQASKQSQRRKSRASVFSATGSLVGRIARLGFRIPVNRIIPLDLPCSTRRSRRRGEKIAANFFEPRMQQQRQRQVPLPLHEIFSKDEKLSERKAY